MNVIRAFVAIHLSEQVRSGIHAVLHELKTRLPGSTVRWVPPENIHLTLKFLGDVSTAKVDALAQALQTEAARHASFQFQVEKLGAFPSLHRPRVIWVGVNAPAALASLQHGVEAELARCGFPPEERAFSPHLTLGRLAHQPQKADVQKISAELERFTVGVLGVTRVTAIHLVRSELLPGGAKYTDLFTADLSGAG